MDITIDATTVTIDRASSYAPKVTVKLEGVNLDELLRELPEDKVLDLIGKDKVMDYWDLTNAPA